MTQATVDNGSVALAERLLAESRDELNRADGKAATLFAVFGIAFGVVLAGVIAGNWTPAELAAVAEVVWWIGTACAIGSLVAMAAAIWPRLENSKATGRVSYFGHVVGYRSREALVEAIERQATPPEDRPVEQLEAISHIVMIKYRLTRAALVLYAVGATACSIAVLVS